jgi:hypothetical protein
LPATPKGRGDFQKKVNYRSGGTWGLGRDRADAETDEEAIDGWNVVLSAPARTEITQPSAPGISAMSETPCGRGFRALNTLISALAQLAMRT